MRTTTVARSTVRALAIAMSMSGCVADEPAEEGFIMVAPAQLKLCWPEQEKDLPGPRPAAPDSLFTTEHGDVAAVTFESTEFLAADEVPLEFGQIAPVHVRALKYFEGRRELAYKVRTAEGEVVEEGTISVVNECPPPDDEPPADDVVTTLFDTCAVDPRDLCEVDPDVFPGTANGSFVIADADDEGAPSFFAGGLCVQEPDGGSVTGEGLWDDLNCVAVLTHAGTEPFILLGTASGLAGQQVVAANPDHLGMIAFLDDGTITDLNSVAEDAALSTNATYGVTVKHGWDAGAMFWGVLGSAIIPGARSADENSHGFCLAADRATGGALYHGATLETLVEVAPCGDDPVFCRCDDEYVAVTCHGDNSLWVYDAHDPAATPPIVITTGLLPWRLAVEKLAGSATGIVVCNLGESSLTAVRLKEGEAPKVTLVPLGFEGPVAVHLDAATLKARVLVNGARKVVQVSLADALGVP